MPTKDGVIRLKNISDKMKHPSTIDVNLTEHPLTRTDEWVNPPIPLREDEDEEQQLRDIGYNPKARSKQYHVVIAPGETVEFGEGREFNEEHGRYIYRTFGSPDIPAEEGKNFNWLIEVDEDGNEYKEDYFSLYWDYRHPNGAKK